MFAGGTYQTADAFLSNAFQNKTPPPSTVWINKEKKAVIEKILQHSSHLIRVRYWKKEQTTAWILNEVGKEKPITVGVIINDNKIQQLKVLAFRESRGWEVKHDFFTRQFKLASLDKESNEQQLNTSIDGISGATLSVRALKKIARIALYLENEIHH